ncbi:uncharacterized protein PAF06_017149 [Gastrophryne carolinensis]
MFCCGACCAQASEEETAPLSVDIRTPKQVKVLEKGERLLLKKVNLLEYDEKFSEMCELYNRQVELRSDMLRCLSGLERVSGSPNLAGCVASLKKRYGRYDPELRMEGYNFSLVVHSAEDIPEGLQEAQNLTKQLSRATKLLLSNQSKLDGMVFSLAQTKSEMESKIKEANTAYLDQIRLVENLEENLKNLQKAKLLSADYREEANGVLREIAAILDLTI